MKRFSRYAALMAMATLTLFATNSHAFLGEAVANASWSIGLKGGATYHTLYGDGLSDVLEDVLRPQVDELASDPRWWFYGGGFVSMHFNKCLALQLEVFYHRTGLQYDGVLAGDEFDFEFDIDYLAVPLLLKMTAPYYGDMIRPFMVVGPYLDIKLNAESDGLDGIPAAVTDLGYLTGVGDDIGDEVNPVDAGVMVGVGLDIKAGPGYLQLEARGAFGFNDVFDSEELGLNAEEVKNAYLMLGGAYAFEF